MEKILIVLILALTLGCCTAAPSDVQNVTGSVDEGGQCLCTVILPDNTFPMHRMESLEITSRDLSISVQKEITKIRSYQGNLESYLERLSNLTLRVGKVELGVLSYTELDFALLKLELKEMESLAVQLRASLSGSNTIVETLFIEIHNISVMVNQLESYDKNNVLAVRREMATLRKRLQDCEKNQTISNPPPVSYGTCDHGGLVNVSKPFVVQLNWRGFSYKYGGWGRDSFVNTSNKSLLWVAALNTDARMMQLVHFHPAYDDLLLYKNPTDKTLSRHISGSNFDYSNCGQGSGMTLYNNSLYYNCYNSRYMCRMNLDTNEVQRQILPDAVYNNRFSYAAVTFQDMDFAADEEGLWVLYSTEESAGNIIIGKLNVITNFGIERTWFTTQYKPGVTNAFMICGVLYATRPVNTRREEIFYMYDTKTGKEGKLSIIMDKMMETVQNIQYNPNDHKLYMYNDGYLVTYDAAFLQSSEPQLPTEHEN
ncbi:olfactomedin-4 [Microcaecilia unicolor]|uniref:Olfactomedin-4-like n=1 Tax=Microcaecilia unicolor TaxID=1415580 RepID=A0A6P7ZCK6_9AMPH|nr:olfactomedin-4-like [Microcaecilia unicolor]